MEFCLFLNYIGIGIVRMAQTSSVKILIYIWKFKTLIFFTNFTYIDLGVHKLGMSYEIVNRLASSVY